MIETLAVEAKSEYEVPLLKHFLENESSAGENIHILQQKVMRDRVKRKTVSFAESAFNIQQEQNKSTS